MVKRKKKAKPRRCRAVATPPPQWDDYPDDNLSARERLFLPLYHGLNTKEEILQSVETDFHGASGQPPPTRQGTA